MPSREWLRLLRPWTLENRAGGADPAKATRRLPLPSRASAPPPSLLLGSHTPGPPERSPPSKPVPANPSHSPPLAPLGVTWAPLPSLRSDQALPQAPCHSEGALFRALNFSNLQVGRQRKDRPRGRGDGAGQGKEGGSHLHSPLELLTSDRPVEGLKKRHTGGQGGLGPRPKLCLAEVGQRHATACLSTQHSCPSSWSRKQLAYPCTHSCTRSRMRQFMEHFP